MRYAVPSVMAAIALSLGVVACGDDDDGDNGSGDAGADSAAAAQLQGEPLRVGLICGCSGPAAGTAGGLPELAEAWEQYTNANGGINGHPVDVILVDTRNDPATAQRVVRELVEQDRVQALVYGDYQGTVYAEYTASQKVPVTGGNSVDLVFATQPDGWFPSGATFPTVFYGPLKEAAKAGQTRMAVLACQELPVCAGVPDLSTALGKLTDPPVDVVYTGTVSATQPSFTSVCLAARDADANSMQISHSSEVVVRMAEGCAQQNYRPLQVNTSSVLGANILDSPAMDGVITSQNNVPLGVEGVPGLDRFNEAMDEYASDYKDSSQYGPISLNIWSGFELFKAAAERANADASTPASTLFDTLYTVQDETLGGIAPPLTFVPGQPSLPACYFVQTVEDGEYAAPQGAQATCLNDEELRQVGEVIAAAG